MFGFPKVYAQETQPPPPGPGADASSKPNAFQSMLPMLVIFFAIMYFLIIRPNQKREKDRRNLLASLAKGDEVVTSGGLCGTITGLNEKIVTLRVSSDPDTKVDFLRSAVNQVMPQSEDKKKK